MILQSKGENMLENISLVWINLIHSIENLLSIFWGKILVVILFILSVFSPISGLIHVTLILVFIDLILGVSVTLKKKGVDEIVSNKLRNTLFKTAFYLGFLMLSFLIEREVAGVDCYVPKLIFSIMGAVELWSIAGNALILSPKMPFLKLLRKYLTSEIAKKMEIDKRDVEETLNNKDEKKKDGKI